MKRFHVHVAVADLPASATIRRSSQGHTSQVSVAGAACCTPA